MGQTSLCVQGQGPALCASARCPAISAPCHGPSSPKQTAEFIQQKSKERDEINLQIKDLSIKRQQYIDASNKKSGNEKDDLGKAIETSIIELGLKIGYKKSGN